ncbi:MAG: inositol monophosphatase family protein [Phycisphaerae bacterium]|jgi:histidinol phosphatase-like enzyme (inositol monophosphatase family)
MDAHELREVLDFAVDAARQAGDLTLRYFSPDTPFERKSDNSPVTIADRAAEQLLRERIGRRFPTHGVLGEEFGEQPGRSRARWILDPIDGTFSFICGVPLFGVLVGFESDGRMLAGVAHFPALRETTYAARGLGCRWQRGDEPPRTARVSGVADLSAARLMHTGVKNMHAHGRWAALERLRDAVQVDRSWCDAYGYLLVATGRAEIALDPIMNIWDNAALAPILTEAGGTFTDWSGRATHTAPEALATNGLLFEPTLRLVRECAEPQPRNTPR